MFPRTSSFSCFGQEVTGFAGPLNARQCKSATAVTYDRVHGLEAAFDRSDGRAGGTSDACVGCLALARMDAFHSATVSVGAPFFIVSTGSRSMSSRKNE